MCNLTEDVLGVFDMLKKVCLEAPVLSFADFNKPFLLETDASKQGLGNRLMVNTILWHVQVGL